MLNLSFETTPIWAVFCITVVLILVATELGFRLSSWKSRGRKETEDTGAGVATGAVLGLGSFLLAFTFGIAASNFGDRRAAVLHESNTIGTAYLRADLLSPEPANALRALLREYVKLRVDATHQGVANSELAEMVHRSEQLHKQMWSIAVDAARETPTPMTALVLSALNDVIDIHSERVAVGIHRMIPPAVWGVLILVAVVGLASTSYRVTDNTRRRSELLPALIFSFAAVITLIADLDNPRKGALHTDQSPMSDLLASITPPGE